VRRRQALIRVTPVDRVVHRTRERGADADAVQDGVQAVDGLALMLL
jgi:hypothetical protein